jgi:microcystin-dependent protein
MNGVSDTLAEIRMFAGNFAPRGWVLCQGQLMSIAQWTAVFALVGTIYGGDGITTFGIPDFRGRVAFGTGSGPGIPSIQLGQMAGTPSITLLSTNLPLHNHAVSGTITMQANADGVLSTDPNGRWLGPVSNFTNSNSDLSAMAPLTYNLLNWSGWRKSTYKYKVTLYRDELCNVYGRNFSKQRLIILKLYSPSSSMVEEGLCF